MKIFTKSFFIRTISLIQLICYILILLFINFGTDQDYESYYNKYNNCLKDLEKENKTSSLASGEKYCKKYIKNTKFFVSYLLIYAYIVFNFFLKASTLLNESKNSCQYSCRMILLFIKISSFFIFLFFLLVYFTISILLGIDFIIDIIIMIISFCNRENNNQNNESKLCSDCLDVYVQIYNIKKLAKINNEIATIDKENNLLREENQKLAKRRVSNNIEDKKIEFILWYIKNTYNKILSSNILYECLLKEIKQKFGKEMDKTKLEKIFLCYIKEKFKEYLNCPLSANIFDEPVITPEGQTFEKNYILKSLEIKEENPLTRNKLYKSQLIENTIIKNICEILNQDELSMDNYIKIKKLLINPKNNKLYSNPIVLKEGFKKGETEEGNHLTSEYSNKVILNIIEQNMEILNDEFFEDINENNINSLYDDEEIINTDTRLNIEINTKNN